MKSITSKKSIKSIFEEHLLSSFHITKKIFKLYLLIKYLLIKYLNYIY